MEAFSSGFVHKTSRIIEGQSAFPQSRIGLYVLTSQLTVWSTIPNSYHLCVNNSIYQILEEHVSIPPIKM